MPEITNTNKTDLPWSKCIFTVHILKMFKKTKIRFTTIHVYLEVDCTVFNNGFR